MKGFKTVFLYIIIIATAALSALNYKIFVFPNSFAPAGVDGVCTMVQYLTSTNMGYLSLLVNVPLLVVGAAFFALKKDYVIKTSVYIVSFSLATILLDFVDLSSFIYSTQSGTSIVLAPIAGGVIRGLLYPLTMKAGGTSGGVDVIAGMVRYKMPHYNMMNIIFALNASVAVLSYFVYGFKIEPVICSIIYAFVTSTVSKSLQSLGQEQVKFEIITSNAENLCLTLTGINGVSATLLDAQGAYSGQNKKMVICVASKANASKIENALKDFKDSVVFESKINASMIL